MIMVGIGVASSVAAPNDPMAAVDFKRDIQPIFQTRCISCHGVTKQRGGLRLDQREAALHGGDNGPVLTAAKGAAIPLLNRVTSTDKTQRMPPTGDRWTPGNS